MVVDIRLRWKEVDTSWGMVRLLTCTVVHSDVSRHIIIVVVVVNSIHDDVVGNVIGIKFLFFFNVGDFIVESMSD